MKKFIQIIDKSNKDSSHTHSHVGNFIGKSFTVGKHVVTVEDTIAEGGFALVFLVKTSGGVRYALKRMYVNKEDDLACAKNEIYLMKLLSGPPTLVGYVDSSVVHTGNGVYEVLLLMHYIKKDLLHFMNEKIATGLSESEILKIFCDICDSVGRLHHINPPIIHRDLKVENILIDSDNHYVLCDFGSATQQQLHSTADTMADIEDEIQRYTTMAYRSPEMVDLYLDKPITHKADIWAMGCLLFKLCFFKLPFEESPLAITSGNFTIPENKYSMHMHNIIRYMLEPDPNMRPDIYQVSSVVHSLANLESPVQNISGSVAPTLDQLQQIVKERDQHIGIKISCLSHAPVIEGTSVAPRQRPKGSQAGSAMVKGLPLPLPSHGRIAAVSPEVPMQQEDRCTTQEQPPAVPKDTGTDSFPPSDLFGANTFSIGSGPFFPPSGYPDPFESSKGTDTADPPSGPAEGHHASDSVAFNQVSGTQIESTEDIESPLNTMEEVLGAPGQPGPKGPWNPFSDPESFAQLSEDHIFGAEFDLIRQGSQNSENSTKVAPEDDPFDAAPFSQGRCSKMSSQSKSSSRGSRPLASTSPSPVRSGDYLANDHVSQAKNVENILDFVRPPLEDRSKYEKLQNSRDEESDEDATARTSPKCPTGLSDQTDTPKFTSVSEDDSIGSASDLKDRDDIGSSVYHGECESVTTHEEDPDVIRGPKPNRAMLRARARALRDQEQLTSRDRLLGHESGEKPLLLDDELDLDGSIKENDIFAAAPFRQPEKKFNPRFLANQSEPCSSTASPLEVSSHLSSEIVTPPTEFNSPDPISGRKSAANLIHESVEFPIYENVTLNEGQEAAAKNPFLNPFLTEPDPETDPVTPECSILLHSSTDIFGCTPFSSSQHDLDSPSQSVACSTPDRKASGRSLTDPRTDEDLFGSIPFQPILNVVTPAKSRTLPANMSSILKSQLSDMAKHEQRIRASDPSDSDSSETDHVVALKKHKHRDHSKDRLKYKNIGDEFEDDNLMVLPSKNFALSKKNRDKMAKKSKKIEKLEKADKKQDKKSDKKQDKLDKSADKKLEKIDKKDKKSDIGISNMSFEDFAADDTARATARKTQNGAGSDLRLTGGNRFGSLKRGFTAISKLGR